MENIEMQTKKWLANFVIGLNLCPFAKVPFKTDKIRYRVYEGKDEEGLALALADELLLLQAIPAATLETTLIIHPQLYTNFLDYNDFLEIADNILLQTGMAGEVQIASFHPDYQFADTAPDDRENYTNRSPFPMLHLLREASVEKAVDFYPDAENIPLRNTEKLRAMSLEEIERLRG